jgi:hypothetical protein
VASFQPIGQAAGGDLGGAYPNPTVLAIRGIPVSATTPTSGQVLKYNGASYVPSNDNNTTYTAGAGIAINGSNVISNTAPNVVQTLSISGQDLTLSDGGGTVTIPGGASDALGTGFTAGGGSGTIPASTTATAQGDFSILGADETGDNAGVISIISGDSDEGKGGDFALSAGSGAQAGDFFMTAGNGTDADGIGGQLAILAGNNTNGFGGVLDMRAGNGGEEGGSVNLVGGDAATGTGGNVALSPGNGASDSQNGRIKMFGNGYVPPPATAAEIAAFSVVEPGQTVFCTDCTANDGSTGVTKTYNGSTWKPHW